MKEDAFSAFYNRNVQMVFKICCIYLTNRFDAEDAVQTTFTRAFERHQHFNNVEHEKAWLVVTASNICKSLLRRKHRTEVSIDAVPQYLGAYDNAPSELLQIILTMPEKYKLVIYLYYYEGYSCTEIAAMLNKKESTIRSQLHRGREYLKSILGDDFR